MFFFYLPDLWCQCFAHALAPTPDPADFAAMHAPFSGPLTKANAWGLMSQLPRVMDCADLFPHSALSVVPRSILLSVKVFHRILLDLSFLGDHLFCPFLSRLSRQVQPWLIGRPRLGPTLSCCSVFFFSAGFPN